MRGEPGNAEAEPPVVVLAEMPAAGNARILGALNGPEDGLRIGAPVVGAVDPPSVGVTGYPAIKWSLT